MFSSTAPFRSADSPFSKRLAGLVIWDSLTTQSQLSLGDARAYYLSTAKNELGVVFAKSPAGESSDLLCSKLFIIDGSHRSAGLERSRLSKFLPAE
jgi:hypothetical protein